MAWGRAGVLRGSETLSSCRLLACVDRARELVSITVGPNGLAHGAGGTNRRCKTKRTSIACLSEPPLSQHSHHVPIKAYKNKPGVLANQKGEPTMWRSTLSPRWRRRKFYRLSLLSIQAVFGDTNTQHEPEIIILETMDIYSIMTQLFSNQESISWLMCLDGEDNRYRYREISLIPSTTFAKPELLFSSPISPASLTSSCIGGGSVNGTPSLTHQSFYKHPSDLELKFESGDNTKCLASANTAEGRAILETDHSHGLSIFVSTQMKERGMVGFSCFWCSYVNDRLVPMTKCNILLQPTDLNHPSAVDIIEYSISHGRTQCDHLQDPVVNTCQCTYQVTNQSHNTMLAMKRDPWALWLILKHHTFPTKKGKQLSSSSSSADISTVMSYLKEIDALPMSQPERFCCKLCSTTFSRKYDLKRHVHTKHMPEKRGFACELCSSKFKRREHLSVHYAHIHQKSSIVITL